jgi:nicotinamidase-related amidase
LLSEPSLLFEDVCADQSQHRQSIQFGHFAVLIATGDEGIQQLGWTKPAAGPESTAVRSSVPATPQAARRKETWATRQDLASHQNCCRSQQLRSQYAGSSERRAQGEASGLLAMHHRYRPGDYETWKYLAPIQRAAWQHKTFEYGTWGGEFRAEFMPAAGEIVAQEHWCSSGFANTDLDLQLKKHGIHRLIVIGLIAHTCIEATVRYAAELGYEVNVIRDATADYSDEMMHAALDINMPNYATAVVTTKEFIASISSL